MKPKYRGEMYNQNSDYSAAETISTFLTQNNDRIDRSTLNFMTFTPNLLFKNMPKMFKADELVIQIEDNVIVHPFAQKMVQKYKEAGYKIAINDFQFLPSTISSIAESIPIRYASDFVIGISFA